MEKSQVVHGVSTSDLTVQSFDLNYLLSKERLLIKMAFLRRALERATSNIDINKDVLLMTAIGKIYSWNGYQVRNAGGSGFANCIAEHKNEIYEGTIGGIHKFNLLDDERLDAEIVSQRGSVMSLCSHDGSLFSSTICYPETEKCEIHEVFTDKLIANRKGAVRGMASHKGKLYDGGYGGVYETLSGKKLSDDGCEVLCSQGGVLYACSYRGIIDVFSNKVVNDDVSPLMTHGLCSYNHRLVDAAQNRGVRDSLKNEMIFTFDQFADARYPRDPVSQLSDMISVNGLTFIAARYGKNDALKIIEREYRDQLSNQSVRQTCRNQGNIKTEVVNVIDSGTTVYPVDTMFVPILLAEFNSDPQLGLIHGKGRGHSFMRTKALKDVVKKHTDLDSYDELAKDFFQEGYHIKRVGYVF